MRPAGGLREKNLHIKHKQHLNFDVMQLSKSFNHMVYYKAHRFKMASEILID